MNRTTAKRRSRGCAPSAFTLLEVILALAILAGSVAVLGELIRGGLRNAQAARDLTRAELICESVVSQVVAGALQPNPVSNVPVEYDPRWLYSIALEPVDQQGLMALRVTVWRDAPTSLRPVQCTLVRWIVDPQIEADAAAAQEAAAASADDSSGTGGTP